MTYKKHLIYTLSILCISASTGAMEPFALARTTRQNKPTGTSPQHDRENLRVSALIQSASPQMARINRQANALKEFRDKARTHRNQVFKWIVPASLTIRCNLKNISEFERAFNNEDDETIQLYLCKESAFIQGIIWQDLTAIPRVQTKNGMQKFKDAVMQPKLTKEEIGTQLEQTKKLIKQKKEAINELLATLREKKDCGYMPLEQFNELLHITMQEVARHKGYYKAHVFEIGARITEPKLYAMRLYLLALHGIDSALSQSVE